LEVGLKYSLINETKGNVIAENIIIADNIWTRLRGLMGRSKLRDNEGLLLAPCNAVHMMFMRFPIDVVFLSNDLVVISILYNLKPWHVSPIVRGASKVVELEVGSTEKKRINIGDKLSLTGV
jgi:uncharacterized membrane protein (UPF0127 family)